MENPTYSFRRMNHVFQLALEFKIKSKTVMSRERQKSVFFAIFILSEGFVLFQCIVYWINFQCIYTFIYKKHYLIHFCCLFLKSSKAFSVSLIMFFFLKRVDFEKNIFSENNKGNEIRTTSWKLQCISWAFIASRNRSCHQRCSIIKSVLKDFAKFTGKHLCQSLWNLSLYNRYLFH